MQSGIALIICVFLSTFFHSHGNKRLKIVLQINAVFSRAPYSVQKFLSPELNLYHTVQALKLYRGRKYVSGNNSRNSSLQAALADGL